MADAKTASIIAFNIQMLANSALFGQPIQDILIAATCYANSRQYGGITTHKSIVLSYNNLTKDSHTKAQSKYVKSCRVYEQLIYFKPVLKDGEAHADASSANWLPVLIENTTSDLSSAIVLLADVFADKVQTSMRLRLIAERSRTKQHPILVGIRERFASFGVQRDIVVVDTQYENIADNGNPEDYCFVIPLPNSGPDTLHR